MEIRFLNLPALELTELVSMRNEKSFHFLGGTVVFIKEICLGSSERDKV